MKRRYVDLWLRPKDLEIAEKMLKRSKSLGYYAVAIEMDLEDVQKLKQIAQGNGLKVYGKVVARARNREDVLNAIKRFRHSWDVLTIHCMTREAAMVSLRDGRVDTVAMSSDGFIGLDKHMLSIARNPIELTLKDLKAERYHIQRYRSILQTIDRKGLGLVFSSLAEDPTEQRIPLEMACVLTLLGLNDQRSLDSISNTPLSILIRNEARLSERIYQEGIWIEKE